LSKSQSRGSNSSERGSKSSKDPLPSPVPSNIDRRASSLAQAENETSAKGSVASEHPGQPTPQIAYPPTGRLIVILLSLYISIFLVALDRTIIGPAIPTITNKFHSIEDIGWYGSAYMLTACGFILLYGRIYTFFPTKRVFLASIALFETGSAICGSAPSSKFLILGRAIAGVGSSGIYTGVLLIIMEITPLHRRPLLQGFFGVCFGLASVAGPLLGGVFTESKATWRWCFFLNLPLGAFTIGVVMFFLHLDEKKRRMDWKETIRQLDPLGTLLFLPSIVCLLLALEWGAAEYRWSDPIIIGLLTVFAVLFVAFVAWQFATRKTTATVPARILLKRSVAFGCLSQFTVGATMLTCTLYIPLWFQAIKGVSAMQSGIRTIPLVLSVVIGSIASGAAVHKIGYYTPFMIMGSLCLSVGAGLLTTWNAGSNSGMWIGYQVILGLGVGFTMQHPNIAIQIVLPKKDVPAGTALLSFWQTLGATLCTSIGQNLFLGNFVHALHNIGGMDPGRVVKAGATELKNAVPAELLSRVLTAYNNSLTGGPFLVCMVVACLSVPAALGMEWHSVKKDKQERTALANPTPDEEAGTSAPPVRDQESEHVVTETAEPSSMESGREKVGDKETSPPPIPRQSSRRNTNRKSGEISRVLVSKLNPDLREDLEMSTS
jgi:EmrB/QacA subfamily drug resistance transporter